MKNSGTHCWVIAIALVVAVVVSLPAHAELMALWRFDDGTGTAAADSSGHGNTGYLSALAWTGVAPDYYAEDGAYRPVWTSGRYGGALDFEPSFDEEVGGVQPYSRPMVFVETNDGDALNFDGSFTVAMWLSIDSVNGDGTGGIRAPNWPTLLAKTGAYIFQSPMNATKLFYVWDNPGDPGMEAELAANANPTLDAWIHIACVYDSVVQDLTLYIDGVAQSAAPVWYTPTRAMASSPWDFFIGHYPWTGEGVYQRSYSGKMDDVALFDTALSPELLAAVMAGDFTAWGVDVDDPLITVTPGGVLVAGDTVTLTAPDGGSNYAWEKDGSPVVDDAPRVSGALTRTLTLDPAETGDSGEYICYFETGEKYSAQTQPYQLVITDPASMPAAGVSAALLLLLAAGAVGVRAIRTRRRD